jgi:cytochrome c oxidase subunit II
MTYFNFLSRKAAVLAFLLTLILSPTTSFSAVNIQESMTGMEVSEQLIKDGMKTFESKCLACHDKSLKRRSTGPALLGVTEKRDLDWLMSWIRDSKKMIDSGDQDALDIYNEYNGSPMTPFVGDLTDEQIKSVLMFIENGGWSDKKEVAPVDGQEAGADKSMVKTINWFIIFMFILFGLLLLGIVKTIERITEATGKEVIDSNKVNATLLFITIIGGLIAVIWEFKVHGRHILLNDSSSVHGADIDKMMTITIIICTVVFFITHILLAWFSYRYRGDENRKALFYPDNDKLEIIWTIVPTIVLTVLVLGGLNVWNDIWKTNKEALKDETLKVEVFAYQFGWNGRYAGADSVLGNVNYNLISNTNKLGLAVEDEARALVADLEEQIGNARKKIGNLDIELQKLKGSVGGLSPEKRKSLDKQIAKIMDGRREGELDEDIRRKSVQIRRVNEAIETGKFFKGFAHDDIVVDTIHLVKDRPVSIKIRSRDVIHSLFMKEFRVQMNAVPGMPTGFTFTPNKSTQERRDELGNQEFDYHIICNKICGKSHWNMKMLVVVESQEDYDKWMKAQEPKFGKKEKPSETTAVAINQ